VLLGLDLTMITGIEVGLFLLSLCNVLVFPRGVHGLVTRSVSRRSVP
jgi:hypothetical protein